MEHQIFQHLPPGAWKQHSQFRYSAWRKVPDNAPPATWVTGQQPGDIESSEGSVWSLNSGVPRDALIKQCVHFADGVSLTYDRQGERQSLELWSIHPNGIAGISSSGQPPILDTIQDAPVTGVNFAKLDIPTGKVFLTWKERDGTCQFLLVTLLPHETLDEAALTASLNFDLREDASSRYDKRLPFWALWSETAATPGPLHDALEHVLYALRAPSKPFSHVWCESSPKTLNLNDIHSHVQAWMQIDPAVAVELLRTAIGLRTSDGRIPAAVVEGNDQPLSATAWPLLNQTALIAARQMEDPTILKDLLPRLHSTLLRTIHYMDHSHNDIHSWQSPREALLPDIMDNDLATVDCSSLLLAEIEAHRDLIDLLGMGASVETENLLSSARQIRHNLSGFFYNPDSQTYRDAYMHGAPVSRITLSSVMPLFTTHPDPASENNLQQHLLSSKILKAPNGIRGWQQWDGDEEEVPVDVRLQSLLTLLCEKKNDRWYTPLLRIWMDNAASMAERTSTDCALRASWFLRLNYIRFRPGQTKHPSRVVQWMDKHRIGVVGLPAGAFIMIVLGITLAFLGKKVPPKATIEALVGLAGQKYSVQRYAESIDVLNDLVESRVATPVVLNLLAKSHYKLGDYPQAETYFRRLLSLAPDPAIRLNLALTVYRQDRIDEAQTMYREIQEEFSELSPQVSARAKHCLELMEVDAPPQPLERDRALEG